MPGVSNEGDCGGGGDGSVHMRTLCFMPNFSVNYSKKVKSVKKNLKTVSEKRD